MYKQKVFVTKKLRFQALKTIKQFILFLSVLIFSFQLQMSGARFFKKGPRDDRQRREGADTGVRTRESPGTVYFNRELLGSHESKGDCIVCIYLYMYWINK